MKRTSFVLLSLALLLTAAFAELPQYTIPQGGGAPQPSRWGSTFVLTWNLNPQTGSNFTIGTPVSQVMQSAFDAWTFAPNQSLTLFRGADSTITDANKSTADINLICFVCTNVSFGGNETLAITLTTTSNAAGQSDGHGGQTTFVGQIVKADIYFNPAVSFVTDGSADGNATQDLQTVATHEIGHFFGLDHSGVVRAVMFPFAPPSETQLSWDDLAGIHALYPKPVADVATGIIAGKVTKGSAAVFGAHVFAESSDTSNPFSSFPSVRKTPVGTLTFTDGTYAIPGLPAGNYVVTAEPLDSPVTNTDVLDYAPAFGRSAVDTSFTTRWH